MRNKGYLLLVALLLLCAACGRVDVRPAGEGTDRTAPLFPDYRDVTVPVNIAPLNFYYTAPDGERFRTEFRCGEVTFRFRGREVVWKMKDWKRLLEAARGTDIQVVSSYTGPAGPVGLDWTIHVSADPIDGYLTYRLIEPGFEVWDDLETGILSQHAVQTSRILLR